jgi:small membrane protein
MIIRILLIAGLLLPLAVAFLNRSRARSVNVVVLVIVVIGVALVMRPDEANRLAAWLGIGRGADLILYCWLVSSLCVLLYMYLRILDLEQMMTRLTRELALRHPATPAHDTADGEASGGSARVASPIGEPP